MEFSQKQTIQAVAMLLLLTVITQAAYTALYVGAKDLPRLWLWGVEGLVFVLLAALAGSALVQAKQFSLGFSAICASAILNLVQVGIGLTQFGPFREVAQSVDGLAPAAGGVVALSFFIYNAAKVLLGLAALVFASAEIRNGSKALGVVTFALGSIAIAANAIVMAAGKISGIPSGALGVVATLFLAICVFKLRTED